MAKLRSNFINGEPKSYLLSIANKLDLKILILDFFDDKEIISYQCVDDPRK